MNFEFKLPDIGEGMVEGEISKWHVKPGDTISEDQPMLDVMTDKATVTIPAPKSGKVLECRGKEGEVVKVGSILVVINTTGAAALSTPSVPSPPVSHPPVPQRSFAPVLPSSSNGGKKLATPATRRLARELKIDLIQISGTGPGGRVTQEDVKQFAERKVDFQPESPQRMKTQADLMNAQIHPLAGSAAASELIERIPLRGLRKRIAEKMSLSKSKIPHFTYVEELDASELVELRDKTDEKAKEKGIRLTFLPFIIKAVVLALQQFPLVNSVLDEEKQEIILKKEYNIGIAAATQEGLTVPVVKRADQKSLIQIAKEVNDLGDKARSGKLSLDELQGSTFTITSLGPLGGIFATPIINYPEVAILGVHKIHKRPVVRQDQIVIRDMAYLSLSFDHRVIDGEIGARFTQQIIEYLQSPAWTLMQ